MFHKRNSAWQWLSNLQAYMSDRSDIWEIILSMSCWFDIEIENDKHYIYQNMEAQSMCFKSRTIC